MSLTQQPHSARLLQLCLQTANGGPCSWARCTQLLRCSHTNGLLTFQCPIGGPAMAACPVWSEHLTNPAAGCENSVGEFVQTEWRCAEWWILWLAIHAYIITCMSSITKCFTKNFFFTIFRGVFQVSCVLITKNCSRQKSFQGSSCCIFAWHTEPCNSIFINYFWLLLVFHSSVC